MIEYIAIGAGFGAAILYSIYEDYQFRKLDNLVDECSRHLEELSKQENVDKLCKLLENDVKKKV